MESKISVIVQGRIDKDLTSLCLASLRKYLPKAEIILSTWNGSDVSRLDYDHVLFNDEPESFFYSSKKDSKLNNINKQIVSTLYGIKKSKRKYVLKLRSDFLLNGNTFIDFFGRYEKQDSDFLLFKHKIMACSYFCRDPRRSNLAFHPSDIAFFGLREDLLNLFDVPLMDKREEYYLKNNKGEWINRYLPEQYLFVNFLRKNGRQPLITDQLDIDENFIEQTERFFASNFIILNWKLFNLSPPKKFCNCYKNDYFSCITFVEWKKLYIKYACNNCLNLVDYCILIIQDTQRLNLKIKYSYLFFLKIFTKLITIPLFGKNNKKLRKRIRDKIILFCSF